MNRLIAVHIYDGGSTVYPFNSELNADEILEKYADPDSDDGGVLPEFTRQIGMVATFEPERGELLEIHDITTGDYPTVI